MRPRRSGPQLSLPTGLIVDCFAGGGGASTGIEMALGRSPDIAINHDRDAVRLHARNHPRTRHYCEDVFDVDPVVATSGRPVALAWFSPDCFPAGTMVLAREGYRPIEELHVGDEVLTHQKRWRRVTNVMRTRKPLLRIHGRGHPGLLVSAEHPFYARKRRNIWNVGDDGRPRGYRRSLEPVDWVRAEDLDAGWYWASPTDFPAATVPPVYTYRQRFTTITPDLLWLAGRYVADGLTRLTHDRAELVITCGRHESLDVREKLSSCWPRSGMRAGTDEMAWHKRETATADQFSVNHRGFVEWLREHFGHGAAEKLIPGWALGMERDLREALMAGYASGDGHVRANAGNPLFMCTTVSKALAFGIKALGLSLGYSPGVYYNGHPNAEIEGRTVNARTQWGVRWRMPVDPAHVRVFREDGFEWAPVRSQEDAADDAEVFNISVEEDESYVVEGIVVHNCTYHSKARGGKPFRDPARARRRRGLAGIVVKWAKAVHPAVILLENVEEFQQWGPLVDGVPDKTRKGLSYRRWLGGLRNAGYVVETRLLRACDYGAPTTRRRLFLIARCDGRPIVWPEPTHGPGRIPYLTAAGCIDWSLPCPSIFGRKKPLAPKTMARIARGVFKFVIGALEPFIAPLTHEGPCASTAGSSLHRPADTVTTQGHHALIAAHLQRDFGQSTGSDASAPLPTVTAGGGGHAAAVASHLSRFYGTGVDSDMRDPIRTVTTGGNRGGGHFAEVRAFLTKWYGQGVGQRVDDPLGVVPTHGLFGLVTVHGGTYSIDDIGMRMLQPRELFRAQGFPDSFEIDRDSSGRALTKTEQIALCGNSVCPPIAAALVAANVAREEVAVA